MNYRHMLRLATLGLCFLFATLITCEAQLSIEPFSFRISKNGGPFVKIDTLRPGDSYIIRLNMRNDTLTPITDNIDLVLARGDSTNMRRTLTQLEPVTTVGGLDTVTLSYRDTVRLQDPVLTPRVNGGGAVIIVVWPAVRTNPPVNPQGESFLLFVDKPLTSNTHITPFEKDDFVIFPNPTHDRLQVQAPVDLLPGSQVEVMDMMGKRLYSAPHIPGSISVSGWKPGVYILRIRKKEGPATQILFQVI